MQLQSRGTADLQLAKSHFRALWAASVMSKTAQKGITKGREKRRTKSGAPQSLRDASFLRDSCCERPKVL